MTEIEKIAYAKSFIDKLANGINPLDDTPVGEDDVVNNVRISRCLFYVSNILQGVIDKDMPMEAPPEANQQYEAPALEEWSASEAALSPAELARRIKNSVDGKPISGAAINRWLVAFGFLEESLSAVPGRKVRVPTQEGENIGISFGIYETYNGPYAKCLFNAEAQQFIFDNLDAIIAHKAKERERRGEPWTEEDEAILEEMIKNNASTYEMAKVLKRTTRGVYMHILTLKQKAEE